MQLLDHFRQCSIIHQKDGGWEPFNHHNCGPLSLSSLRECLEIIYGSGAPDMARLNACYMQTSPKPLAAFERDTSVGLKMRFDPPVRGLPLAGRIPALGGRLTKLQSQVQLQKFRKMMIDLLKKCNVVVFVMVRQDVLRWALSKYHGDGSGRKGHLQFKLAMGEITREQIPNITVDCGRLEGVILECERSLRQKRDLASELGRAGIKAYPLFYEEFCRDKRAFLKGVFERLENPVSDNEIEEALKQGTFLEKVHSDDISDFVTNHEEVLTKFGGRYFAW